MPNASRKAGLGKTLMKAQKFANERRNPRKSTSKHVVDTQPSQDNARLNLKSVTAQTNLDEFFEEAELAGKQFVTERRNMTIINEDQSQIDLYRRDERLGRRGELPLDDADISKSLCVPRRPKWDSNTTPEQLDEMERLSFLVWRRKLARLQENDKICLTPFEKNLEVWRQLWRVLERSDLVVQILDCRNPLLYLCEDLIKYVDEEFGGSKMNLMLMNKADYLSREQRKMWYDYFSSRGIKTIFFSALYENDSLKKPLPVNQLKNQQGTGSTSDVSESSGSDQENKADQDEDANEDDAIANGLNKHLNLDDATKIEGKSLLDDETRIYDKFELLDTWREILESRLDLAKNGATDQKEKDSGNSDNGSDIAESKSNAQHSLTIGLVGYPNVGKSSTINALLSAKRVAVSATPGKTKHFQTFLVESDMVLCDCPGLVFPNFINSKSEMVVNGILPIDQMKDCLGPVRIIVSRIPRAYFEEIYGLAFEQSPEQNITAEDLLNSFGFMRGYMTARGLPDISRAARKVCKDYINGKILYCEPPPTVEPKLYHSHSKIADLMKQIEERAKDVSAALRITERQRRLMIQAKGTAISSREFDANYFKSQTGGAHIKGLPGIGTMCQPIGQCLEVKVAKRDKKHKKREKLRRVYRDLDI